MNCPNCGTANPDDARFCFHCGTALHAARPTQGERKLVTILFADVVGSTALAEKLDPEDVTDIMNGAFALLNAAVAAQGGTVARLMGDAILAFFGAPVAHEDDPEQAIRAALLMQEKARGYADQVREKYGIEFKVRVGINTGLALLDIVGDQVRAEYTAMGDAVNLASRLEHAARPGGILISYDTYRHVRGLFEVRELEPIQVKGKAEPVEIYEVLSARPRAFRVPTRGVAGVDAPMVGREAEMQRLQEVFHEVQRTRAARMATVVADAGVGKSRLLSEFIVWLNQQPEAVSLFKARASEDRVGRPFSLLRDLFAFEFEIQDNDSEAWAKEKLEKGIKELVGPGHEDIVPFLGHLIGFDYSSSPSLEGILDDARQVRDRAFQVMAQVVTAAVGDQATVMAMEDLHWADDGSLDLIEHLMRACSDLPLMILAVSRPTLFERRSSLGEANGSYVRVDLEPLPAEAAHQLVAELLRKLPDVPSALSELIVARAEGNPYYVEELIQMLIDEDVITRSEERWQVNTDRLSGAKVPPTLTGVLQARLDGLSSELRSALQRASVVGRVFWDEVLARLEESDKAEAMDDGGGGVVQALSGLRGKELIYPNRPSSFTDLDEYSFKHTILRDVTYETVLKKRRRDYHEKVAAWLSERTVEQGPGFAGRIADHYERGEQPALAAEWYARAGKQARDAYAPETAVEYYRKALALQPVQGRDGSAMETWRIQVYEGLGQVLVWLGRYQDAVEAYHSMGNAAEAIGDRQALARAWHGIAETQLHEGEFRAAIESAEAEEKVAQETQSDLLLAKALWVKAWAEFRIGEIDTALPLAERVWEISNQLPEHEQKAHALNLLGVLRAVSGETNQAALHFEQALEIFRDLGNRRRALPLLNNLGVISEGRGDFETAFNRYEEALRAARDIGNRDGEMVYLSNLGAVKARLGEYASAEEDLRAVIRMAGPSQLDVLPYTFSFLGETLLEQGRKEEALEAAQHAMALSEEMESQQDLATAWRVLGRISAALGAPVQVSHGEGHEAQLSDAESCFAQSEHIFRELDRKEEIARTLVTFARYAFETGQRARGQAMWQEAKELFEQVGADFEVQRMAKLPQPGG